MILPASNPDRPWRPRPRKSRRDRRKLRRAALRRGLLALLDSRRLAFTFRDFAQAPRVVAAHPTEVVEQLENLIDRRRVFAAGTLECPVFWSARWGAEQPRDGKGAGDV